MTAAPVARDIPVQVPRDLQDRMSRDYSSKGRMESSEKLIEVK